MKPAKQILSMIPAAPGTVAIYGCGDGSEQHPCRIDQVPVIAWASIGVPCVPLCRDEDGEYRYPDEDEQGYISVQPIVRQEPGYFAADDDVGPSSLMAVILPGEDFGPNRQKDMLDEWTERVHYREQARERRATAQAAN